MSWTNILRGIICIGVFFASGHLSYAQSERDRFFRDQGFDRSQTRKPGQQQHQDEYYQNLTPRQKYCFSLEKRLAQNWITKANSRKNLPQLNQEIRDWNKKYRKAERRLERGNCYRERFLFGRELRNTRKCRRMDKELNTIRTKLQELEDTKRRATTTDTRDEDDLISQLARSGCGAQYEKEDRKRNRFSFIFDDDDEDDRGDRQSSTNILPFATYRTMCVRTCDGFYYPVSFSTLQSRFPIDAQKCQAQCAAPAKLFVYKNPGEKIEQMVSLNGEQYTQMPYAFRYRKKYVEGCSCRQDEFSPEKLGLKGEENGVGLKDNIKKNATNSQKQKEKNIRQKSENKRKKIEYIE